MIPLPTATLPVRPSVMPPAAPAVMLPMAAPGPGACPAAAAWRPWQPPPKPTHTTTAGAASPAGAAPPASDTDYRHQLTPTPAGWPIRPSWCVWIEPSASDGPAALWDQRWRKAVGAALNTWQRQLPIQVVLQPEQAQVLVQRRRPPIQNKRASHGRALLQLLEVQRDGRWQLEPRVEVLISPGQPEPAIQATALHELGHAFGLWGHSDHSGDAMAVSPGAKPVLELSGRDRATLEWLQRQSGLRQDLRPTP